MSCVASVWPTAIVQWRERCGDVAPAVWWTFFFPIGLAVLKVRMDASPQPKQQRPSVWRRLGDSLRRKNPSKVDLRSEKPPPCSRAGLCSQGDLLADKAGADPSPARRELALPLGLRPQLDAYGGALSDRPTSGTENDYNYANFLWGDVGASQEDPEVDESDERVHARNASSVLRRSQAPNVRACGVFLCALLIPFCFAPQTSDDSSANSQSNFQRYLVPTTEESIALGTVLAVQRGVH